MRQVSPNDEIEVNERYDQEDDIYYLTLRTGEPSIVDESDDQLLLEKGIFTQLPTGFRILNYSQVRDKAEIFAEKFKEYCKKLGLKKVKISQEAGEEMNRISEKVFA